MLHTQSALVDRLAEIRALARALADEESDIRAALLALKMNVIEGDNFTAIVKAVPSTRIDTAAVKKEMGSDWYSAHSVTSSSIRIETVAKAGV